MAQNEQHPGWGGIMGGRKKSHYQKLVEMAEQGNEKAADILGNLEVKNI